MTTGVVWAKLAKGEPNFTSDLADPNGQVPLRKELTEMLTQWQNDAQLPQEKPYVDSNDWFADF